jgi:hypothetical protein
VFTLLLVLALGAGVYAVARRLSPTGTRAIVVMVIVGYTMRLIFSLFVQEIPFFSHGAGGQDNGYYEYEALTISRLWTYGHVHYVTAADLPELGRITFPTNLFALVVYLNDGPSSLGCTAVIAFLACLTCLNIFALAIESGASYKASRLVLGTLIFLPSFMYYTSGAFKDGIVQFCVVGIVGSALRLSRKFSFKHVVFGLVCLAALEETRFYLIYVTIPPLVIGALGLRSRSSFRTVVSITAMCLGLLMVLGLTQVSETLVDDASTTFATGTSDEVIDANSASGSGVQVQGSSPSAYAVRLVYTLFAPFFWQSGSLGFQIGKVDALVWYALAFLAAKSARKLSKSNRSELLILLSFVVPTTFAYAAAFANVGLTVRERLGVVMICALLGAMGTSPVEDEARVASPVEKGSLRPRLGL